MRRIVFSALLLALAVGVLGGCSRNRCHPYGDCVFHYEVDENCTYTFPERGPKPCLRKDPCTGQLTRPN